MTEKRYYHTVRGKRKLCRLWLPPDSNAYWHMCGDPEDVAALSIPTSGGVIELNVKGRDHAYKVEAVMKELKFRAQHGNIGRGDFDMETFSFSDERRSIDLLLVDLGVPLGEMDAMRDYADLQVRKAAGPRVGRPRPVRGVRVQPYTRRRYYVQEPRRGGHKVWVGSEKWPSQVGMSHLRRHRKRFHPRAFRASIRKGVATREARRKR